MNTETMTDAEFVRYLVDEYVDIEGLRAEVKAKLEYALDYYHENKDIDTMSEIVLPSSGEHDDEAACYWAGHVIDEIENRGAIDRALDDVLLAVIEAA